MKKINKLYKNTQKLIPVGISQFLSGNLEITEYISILLKKSIYYFITYSVHDIRYFDSLSGQYFISQALVFLNKNYQHIIFDMCTNC